MTDEKILKGEWPFLQEMEEVELFLKRSGEKAAPASRLTIKKTEKAGAD